MIVIRAVICQKIPEVLQEVPQEPFAVFYPWNMGPEYEVYS